MTSISDQPNYRPKKRFGQNFMIDNNIIDIIICSAELNKEDTVLEIGAGKGELTAHIAKTCKVIAVEIDRDLCGILKEKFSDNPNITILQQDILKLNLKDLNTDKMKVVANIPYYITTPIIFKLLESKKYFDSIILTVQKEIAERIVSKEGSKKYGVLSIMVQYNAITEYVRTISKNSFSPMPKVDSAIIKLKIPEKPQFIIKNEKVFIDLVKTSFQQRRKTFRNALLRFGINKEETENIFKELKLDINIRGEDLSINQFVEISNILKVNQK